MSAKEIKSDMLLNALPWRCFGCDFVTNDPKEAQAHFGDRDDAEEFKPICKWWQSIAEDERMKVLQDTLKMLAEEQNENMRLRTHIEGLEYQVNNLPAQIKSFAPFRKCNTIYDVFCVYDSIEGELLVEREKNRLAETPKKAGMK